MRRIEFVYDPGFEIPLKREVREYENYETDEKINKDYEEWLVDQVTARGQSYWNEFGRLEDNKCES